VELPVSSFDRQGLPRLTMDLNVVTRRMREPHEGPRRSRSFFTSECYCAGMAITPFLWFNHNADEAIALYTSVFGDTRVLSEQRGPDGALFSATIEVRGQRLMLLNGGPMFSFNEAFSLFVDCDTQAEIDALWTGLLEGGGTPSRCGWLKDRFGLSWQIVPKVLGQLLVHPDRAVAGRVMQVMLTMSKLDIAGLQAALGS
jgi:predicted 3-demethylubiquinone-9 3-methyltransferase (glyoxalase superfamily)